MTTESKKTQAFNRDALRQAKQSALRYTPLAGWLVSLAVIAVSVVPLTDFMTSAWATRQLATASPKHVTERLQEGVPDNRSADYYETLSRRAASLDVPDIYSALIAARKAVEANPASAEGWTQIARLETIISGRASPSVIKAVRNSLTACRYCDREIMKWRVSYTLSHWDELPQDLKFAARQQVAFMLADPLDRGFAVRMIDQAKKSGISLDPNINLRSGS